jgi:hypothetical protein
MLPAAAIFGKNLLRGAATVGLAAVGAPQGVADAMGVAVDLTLGTIGSASGAIRSEHLNRRDGFRRFLAFDGAAALLRRADEQEKARAAPQPSMAERIQSASRSTLGTTLQVARGVPSGLGAVFSLSTLAKGGVLTAANVAGRLADQRAETWFGPAEETQRIDTSVRRRREVTGDAASAASAASKPGVASSPTRVEAAPSHAVQLEQVAVRESFAALIGGATAVALASTDWTRSKAAKAVERKVSAEFVRASSGLRQRQPWSTQEV